MGFFYILIDDCTTIRFRQYFRPRRNKEQSLQVCSPRSAIYGCKWANYHTQITEARQSRHGMPRETARNVQNRRFV